MCLGGESILLEGSRKGPAGLLADAVPWGPGEGESFLASSSGSPKSNPGQAPPGLRLLGGQIRAVARVCPSAEVQEGWEQRAWGPLPQVSVAAEGLAEPVFL